MTSKKVCLIDGRYYLYERESYWDPVQKRSRQRNSRYIGRCDKVGNLIAPVKPRIDTIHSAFPIGPLSIFYATAKRLNLTEHIENALDVEQEIASHILCLTLNQIISKRPVEKLASWVLKSPLVKWENLSPDGITSNAFGRALSSICCVTPDGDIEDYGLGLQCEMTRVWRGDTREPAQYYYDVTKQTYYGTNSFYGEPGFIHGGTNKHVIGFGLVTSRDNHFPVLCRPIRGSKHDTVTVQDTVNTLRGWGFEHLTMIGDRGMVSKENVDFVVRSGFNMVGIVPETNKMAWTCVTRWSPESLANTRFMVRKPSGETIYARAWTTSLFDRKKMRVVVIEDPERKLEEKLGRDQALRELKGRLSSERLKELKRELGSLAVPAPGRRGFIVDEKKLDESKKGDGRYLMFSTDLSMDAEDIVTTYYQKDIVEKAFRTLKGEIKLGPIRYRRRDRIDAYSTIVYLAYLLWSTAERKLRKKYPEMTLGQALSLVEDISWVRFGSGKLVREWATNMTIEQEKILKYLGAIEVIPVS